MNGRTMFHWIVTLIGDKDGKTYEVPFQSYWSPEQEGCGEAVVAAAKGDAFIAGGKSQTYTGIAAQLQPA